MRKVVIAVTLSSMFFSFAAAKKVSAQEEISANIETEISIPTAKRPLEPSLIPPPPVLIYSSSIASAKEWPATFALGFGEYIKTDEINFRIVCTATLVGERSLITAAHCLRSYPAGAENLNSGIGEDFQIVDHNGIMAKAYCNKAPDYVKGQSHPNDWALCKLNRKIDVDRYETIATDIKTTFGLGLPLTLLGYGCIAFADRNARVYGEFNEGQVKKSYNYGHRKYVFYDTKEHLYVGQAIVSDSNNGFLVTRSGALLCPGDSGGAAYSSVNRNSRRIIGINSQAKLGSTEEDASYIATIKNDKFRFWALHWAVSNKVKICGINLRSSMCR